MCGRSSRVGPPIQWARSAWPALYVRLPYLSVCPWSPLPFCHPVFPDGCRAGVLRLARRSPLHSSVCLSGRMSCGRSPTGPPIPSVPQVISEGLLVYLSVPQISTEGRLVERPPPGLSVCAPDHLRRPPGRTATSWSICLCPRSAQKAAWSNGHRQECAALAGIAPRVPPPTVCLAARALWKQHRQAESTDR
jgi:hypothetical protein